MYIFEPSIKEKHDAKKKAGHDFLIRFLLDLTSSCRMLKFILLQRKENLYEIYI